MTGRTTGVATYRNNDFFGLVDGLNFAAQYQVKMTALKRVTEANGDGFGFSTTYEYEGFGVGATYAKSGLALTVRVAMVKQFNASGKMRKYGQA